MAPAPKLKKIAIECSNGVAIIKFNTPKNGNSLDVDMVSDHLEAILWATNSPDVNVIVQTGEGKFYCTGKQLTMDKPSEAEEDAENALFVKIFRKLNEALIMCDKVLIAAVNGPAVGYGTTSLGLMDLVYSTNDAYFFTPFMKWALCAEGCSSVTFPKIMGYQKAAALLLAEERMTADELSHVGLITKVLSKEGFFNEVMTVARRIASYPPEAVKMTKNLMVKNSREELIAANNTETHLLIERFQSKESKDTIKEFLRSREKSKSKI